MMVVHVVGLKILMLKYNNDSCRKLKCLDNSITFYYDQGTRYYTIHWIASDGVDKYITLAQR